MKNETRKRISRIILFPVTKMLWMIIKISLFVFFSPIVWIIDNYYEGNTTFKKIWRDMP